MRDKSLQKEDPLLGYSSLSRSPLLEIPITITQATFLLEMKTQSQNQARNSKVV